MKVGMRSLMERVEALCAEEIRPMLAAHCGDIRLLDYDGETGTLRYSLLGRCAGCPAAATSTEMDISEMLTQRFPEIRSAAAVNSVSDWLLEQAHSILDRKQ